AAWEVAPLAEAEEGGGGRPLGRIAAELRRRVDEAWAACGVASPGLAALVAQEAVVADVQHQQVLVAVAVEVGGDRGVGVVVEPRPRVADAGRVGHVGEVEVAVVAVEAGAAGGAPASGGP